MARKISNFAVLDLALARIVNGADCWPPASHLSGHDGAIAQLGERVVRNDEVGGSIPPGSTSLRRLRLLRLGKPLRREGCRVVARRAKTGYFPRDPFPRARYACVSGCSFSQPLQRLNTFVMRSGSTPS